MIKLCALVNFVSLEMSLLRGFVTYVIGIRFDRPLPFEEPQKFTDFAERRLQLFSRFLRSCQGLEGFKAGDGSFLQSLNAAISQSEIVSLQIVQVREINMARLLNMCIDTDMQPVFERLFKEITAEIDDISIETESYQVNVTLLYAQFLVDNFLAFMRSHRS